MRLPLLLAFFALGVEGLADEQRFEFREPHMGTTVRIVLYARDKSEAESAAKAAFARVVELNRIMSDYDPDSELSRLCQANRESIAPPTPVSPELFHVLKTGQEIARRSDGAFDMTIGPLVRLWRISRRTQRLPDPATLAEAKARVGFDKLVLKDAERTVQFRVPGMQLDLGGIGKGYTADEILETLKRVGIKRALAAVGGDIAVADAPPGQTGWRVDVASISGDKPQYSLRLANAAVSTTGDKEQFVEINGTRYSHVVDPRTGLGQTGRRSVTVVARRGIHADAMTKAAALLDLERALRLIDETPDAAALIVLRTEAGDEVHQSRRLQNYLDPSPKPPSD
ncbi:MAG: FAD:protein FMN transferase [Gemmataceae bacterium]|nr:FAD:protein FMN transferase [Gemmataceae bacterium]